MSAGHRAHRSDVPAIDDDFYRRVANLVDACRRDRDHTIPWLANRSIDGRVVYIDDSVPVTLPKTGINTGETLPYHELGEWLGMNDGLDYDESHATKGNACEKRRVEELGGDWAAYQEEIAPFIREVDHEAMTKVPADIDARVFIDDGDKAALAAILADNKGSTMPETVRKFVSGAVIADSSLGERQIRVVASDPTVDRVKDVMVPQGCVLDGYAKNNIVLADHNSSLPIGNADVAITAERVEALITFAPKGVSAKADEYCAFYKTGVLKAVSIGFQPLEYEPIKDGGVRYLKWALMELSCVAVPANPNAITIERAMPQSQPAAKASSWKVGASRNLPVDEDSSWDGPAAEKSIFDHCGFDGDSPNTALARKGFLLYDASKPKEKGSYKEPFAKIVGGRMTAVAAGIRSAASRLPQVTGVPDDAKSSARAVIDHYETKMSKGTSALAKAWSDAAREAAAEARRASAHSQMHGALQKFHQALASLAAERNDDDARNAHEFAAGVHERASDEYGDAASHYGNGNGARGAASARDGDAWAGRAFAATHGSPKALANLIEKSGRVLSEANLGHLTEIDKCLKAMGECHEKAARLHDDLHDTLVDMMDHGTSAGDHVKAMREAAGAEDDGADVADPDNSDQELAGEAGVRKRELEFLERSAPLV